MMRDIKYLTTSEANCLTGLMKREQSDLSRGLFIDF